jgi:hypothetical protein
MVSSFWINRCRLKSRPAPPLSLTLADGSLYTCNTVYSGAVCLGSLKIQLSNVYVAPLAHHDMILGMDFLKQFNPSIDWRAKTLTISDSEGQRHVIDAASPPPPPRGSGSALLSYAQLAQEVQAGAEAFICFVRPATEPTAAPTDIPDPYPADLTPQQRRQLTELLLRFACVITNAPPDELPPERPIM